VDSAGERRRQRLKLQQYQGEPDSAYQFRMSYYDENGFFPGEAPPSATAGHRATEMTFADPRPELPPLPPAPRHTPLDDAARRRASAADWFSAATTASRPELDWDEQQQEQQQQQQGGHETRERQMQPQEQQAQGQWQHQQRQQRQQQQQQQPWQVQQLQHLQQQQQQQDRHQQFQQGMQRGLELDVQDDSVEREVEREVQRRMEAFVRQQVQIEREGATGGGTRGRTPVSTRSRYVQDSREEDPYDGGQPPNQRLRDQRGEAWDDGMGPNPRDAPHSSRRAATRGRPRKSPGGGAGGRSGHRESEHEGPWYGVRNGRGNPPKFCIVESWEEAHHLTSGVSRATCKCFETYREASDFAFRVFLDEEEGGRGN